jgi:ACT domain-containing protein
MHNPNFCERGISLEEILQQVGLGRSMVWKYTKDFRTKYTKMGKQDGITGIGSKVDFRKE